MICIINNHIATNEINNVKIYLYRPTITNFDLTPFSFWTSLKLWYCVVIIKKAFFNVPKLTWLTLTIPNLGRLKKTF